MSVTPAISDVSAAQSPYFWGIDLGGTGIKLGLVDDQGRTLAYEWLPTLESEGPEKAMRRVAEAVAQIEQRLSVGDQVLRVGLGAPGPIDLPRGYLVAPPQLPNWCEFPIRDTLGERLGRPISFLNDANAAAYGEYWLGSGQAARSMVLLTLGTGVGGGIIIEGELVNGTNSFGSECGHIIVDSSPAAELCVWGGGKGQLEAYASASGVARRAAQRLAEGAASSLWAPRGAAGGEAGSSALTAKRVYEAAADGDSLALEIIDETARWLGVGVTTIIHIIDPGSVVLGGAMNFGGSQSPIGRRFLKGVSDEFQQRTFDNVYAGTKIAFAALGADAGYLGAAGYARKESGHP